MLGYVISDDRDDRNARMADLAMALMADGWRLAGAVQTNSRPGHDCACDVDLSVLGHLGPPIRISQALGAGARGCRLDPDGLERAVAQVSRTLTARTDLLIVNKFGKQEALGRGFRPAIGDALAEGVPVLLTVAPAYLAEFLDFAGELAQRLEWPEVERWARQVRAAAA